MPLHLRPLLSLIFLHFPLEVWAPSLTGLSIQMYTVVCISDLDCMLS